MLILSTRSGFTLIEMSMVLVVIGLVIGTVLAGQEILNAAAIHAQISQMNTFQAAELVFETKYNFLPGDIPDPQASNFGFIARGTNPGEGDGNGIIEGNCTNDNSHNNGFDEGCGELAIFWLDLTAAGLISDSIVQQGGYPSISAPSYTGQPGAWLPAAKLGQNNFIYLMSFNSTNYFSLSRVDAIAWTVYTNALTPGVTVQQAYKIDNKIDDGLPQSGSVIACYVNASVLSHHGVWAAGGGLQGANGGTGFGYDCTPTTIATAYASTNCYDNNNVTGTQQYSLAQNASLQNCALSFKIQ